MDLKEPWRYSSNRGGIPRPHPRGWPQASPSSTARPPGKGEGRGGTVTGWIFGGRMWFDDIVYVGGG